MKFMDDRFEQFESDVMKKIITEDLSISDLLKEQYRFATVTKRSFTGVGFFTDFEITDRSLAIPGHLNLELGKVHAKIEGLEFGAGFVLFIRDGMLGMLEGYTYNEPWPTDIITYTLD